MKYHLAFFLAGTMATFFSLGHDLNLVSATNLGWIWYNNIWVVFGLLSARK